MYVPRTVTTDARYNGDFECVHCEYACRAFVDATGRGQTTHRDSYEDGSVVAARTLWFVACPRCKRFDPHGDRHRVAVVVGASLLAIITFMILFALGLAMRERHEGREMAFGVGIACGLGAFAIAFWLGGRAWRDVHRRVRLVPHERIVPRRD